MQFLQLGLFRVLSAMPHKWDHHSHPQKKKKKTNYLLDQYHHKCNSNPHHPLESVLYIYI
jgi:hypothetical protein